MHTRISSIPDSILLQVAAKKLTLKNVTDYIVDVICKRADLGYNYGVILIPEGLIDFIPEVPIVKLKTSNVTYLRHVCILKWSCTMCSQCYVYLLFFVLHSHIEIASHVTCISHVTLQVQHLIAELNEILAHDVVDEGGLWKKKLTSQSLQLFEFLPQAIQEQLMLERDPHGNVQVFIRSIAACYSLLMESR